MLKSRDNGTPASEFLRFAVALSVLIIAISYFISVIVDFKKIRLIGNRIGAAQQLMLNQDSVNKSYSPCR